MGARRSRIPPLLNQLALNGRERCQLPVEFVTQVLILGRESVEQPAQSVVMVSFVWPGTARKSTVSVQTSGSRPSGFIVVAADAADRTILLREVLGAMA